MDAFSNVANFLGDVLGSLLYTILAILDVNFILVNHILRFMTNIVCHLLAILDSLLTLLLTAIEDFASFLIEIYQGFVVIQNGFESIRKHICASGTSIGSSIAQLITKCFVSINTTTNSLLNLITLLLDLIYALLCLIMRSIVMLLQLFPYAIFILISSVKNIFILIYKSMARCFNNVASFVAGFTVASVKFVENKVKLIPKDAIYGLALIALCYILYKLHKSGRFRCPPRLLRIGTSLKNKLYHLCEVLLTWFWLLRPRNFNHSEMEIEVIDLEPMNDEASGSHANTNNAKNVKLLEKELEMQKEKNLCIICQDQPKSVILLPCRHMCLCEDCCNELLGRRATCPLCRRGILNPMKVFT